MIAAGIIMSNFVPAISQLWWAVLFGLLVTVINLFHVDKFGESEFWLALFKIIALIGYQVFAGLHDKWALGRNVVALYRIAKITKNRQTAKPMRHFFGFCKGREASSSEPRWYVQNYWAGNLARSGFLGYW